MTKTTSMKIKGIAIVMMVFLHLFNSDIYTNNITSVFVYNDVPLFAFFVPITTLCVQIYLILSGYGLYLSQCAAVHTKKRIFFLYARYWFILLLFVPLGMFFNPAKYPGSLSILVQNILAVNTTYNSECWFIFPYIILLVFSDQIKRLVGRLSLIQNCGLLAVVYGVSLVIVKLWLNTESKNIAATAVINTLSCFSPFYAGMILSRFNLLKFIQNFRYRNTILLTAVFSIAVFKFYFSTSAFNLLFSSFFVFACSQFKYSNQVSNGLTVLGNHSTNMWLCHSYFCYHIFSKYLYSLEYASLILLCTIGMSLMCSIFIDKLWEKAKLNNLVLRLT